MKRMKIIPASFFDRPTLEVAHDLIGCYLVRRTEIRIERHMITETEAYDGPKDLASHASKGRTPRTEIMFGHPGFFYVYFVYGMHWMLNIVTGPKDYPGAVLIRGLEKISGPARLTKKLNITGELNGKAANKEAGLWFEMPTTPSGKIPEKEIARTARIGVEYAGPVWAKKKWRFVLKTKSN